MLLLLLLRYCDATSKAFNLTECYTIIRIDLLYYTKQLLTGVCLETRNVELMETSFAHEHINLTALFLL